MAKGFVNWINNENNDCAASVLRALATAASYEAADATNAGGIVDWSLSG